MLNLSFDHGLIPGQVINNEKLVSIFLCSPQAGMRRSLRTNSLVIVSDHTKSLYEDRWDGNTFHYTGMGKNGDQRLNFQQNKTLYNSNGNGVELHLFEVFKETEYVYMGRVELIGVPYQENQLDEKGNMRLVWVFPLRPINKNDRVLISRELIVEKEKNQERKNRKLSDEELEKRARQARKKGASRTTTVNTFERDSYVIEYAKRWAQGVCQLCEKNAPFKNKKGDPYLHTHHIDWLSRDGDDSIENTVALCPNCHDKMHVVDNRDDIKTLKDKVRLHLASIV